MTRIVAAGFEGRDPTTLFPNDPTASVETLWPTTAAATYDTGITRGAWSRSSGKIVATSGASPYFRYPAQVAYPQFFYRCYVRVTARPSTTPRCLFSRDSLAPNQSYITLNPDGTLSYNLSGTGVLGTSSVALTDTTKWYMVEWRNKDGTNVTVLQIDGVPYVTGSPSSWSTDSAIGAGDSIVNYDAYTAYFDDFAVDDADFPGPGGTAILLPYADAMRAVLWTGGAGGNTGLWDAVNNLPPLGTASETNLTQIEHGGNATGTTDTYMANVEQYDAYLPAGATVTAVTAIAITGEDSGTGDKLLMHQTAANPIGTPSSNYNVAMASASNALGTYPTNWYRHAVTDLNPTVVLNVNSAISVVRPETATRVASVCFLGLQVDFSEAPALGGGTRTATPVTVALQDTSTNSATPVTVALAKLRAATPVTVALGVTGARLATPVTAALNAPNQTHTATPVTLALSAANLTHTATPITAAFTVTRTRPATPVTLALQATATRPSTPVTVATQATLSRPATPVTLAATVTGTRPATPITAAVQKTLSRPATPVTAALSAPNLTHTATPVLAALSATNLVRSASPVTVALTSERTRSATPVTLALGSTLARTGTPVTAAMSSTLPRTASPVTVTLQGTATLTRTATPVTIALASQLSRTASPVTAALQSIGVVRAASPVTVALGRTLSRQATPITGALQTTGTRPATPVTMAVQATATRAAAPVTVALQASPARTATPVVAALQATAQRIATPIAVATLNSVTRIATPVTAALASTPTRAATPVTVAVQSTAARPATPITLALLSTPVRSATPVGLALQATLARIASPVSVATAGVRMAAPITASITNPNWQHLLPVADVSAGAWTPDTGTDLYSRLNEATADPASYVQSEPGPLASPFTIRLGPPIEPNAGTRTLWVQIENDDVGATIGYRVEVLQGATVRQDFGSFPRSDATVTVVGLELTASIVDWATPFDVRVTANTS